MKNQIAWIDGSWGSTAELALPLRDRGLQLADGIFETILILDGHPQLLNAHLSRWQTSACLLGMAPPPTAQWLTPLIKEGLKQCNLDNGNGALRLNWSRGDRSSRGISLPQSNPSSTTHRFWLELNAMQPCFTPLTTIISCHERRNANSRLSRCKTFAYCQAIQARHEAQKANCDEAILLSTSGELCCGSTANLIVRRNNHWLTPRLASGCLPGVMRQQGLEHGWLQESQLEATPEKDDQWLLINSLSCQPIVKLDDHLLRAWSDPEGLWYSLLKANNTDTSPKQTD